MTRPPFALLALCVLLSLSSTASAQTSFPLWPGGAPGALGDKPEDIPTLTVYLPDPSVATGAAMVICPGGGYVMLAGHEGKDYALFLNEHGVAGFVLKYRLGSKGYRHPAMLQDAARAVRTVRARAPEWKVDPARIGIMGSSAGGHLASTLLTHFDAGDPAAADAIDRVSSRPDLGVLCYPVVTMREPYVHKGSRQNLLGQDPPQELIDLLSNELHVTARTPPCFIWATWEDNTVPIENSIDFALALQKAHVPFDLHIFQQGRHGIGLANGHPWTKDLVYWLRVQNFVKQ